MSTTVQYQFLEARAKSAYRQLFVKGSRIRADVLYRACTALDELTAQEGEESRTPDQVAIDYSLPLPAVLEAIEYCRSQPIEIVGDHAREEKLMDASGVNHPDYKNDPKRHYRLLSPNEWAALSQ